MVAAQVDSGQLVFVDEMGLHTSLAPLYGYSPKGERVRLEVPRNLKRQEHNSFGLHDPSWCDGRDDGCRGLATDREVFETYVEHVLAPTLECGQVVIMDNLLSPQTSQGEGADRGAGLRATLPTLLLTGFQPDRGSVQQDQRYGAPSGSSHEGGID
jgi:hypothetical protein